MMKLLWEKFAKFALLRAAVFGAMGIVTLQSPNFLRDTAFYVIVGYVFLCGIWTIADYLFYGRDTNALIRYGSLTTAALMLGFSIFSIIYGRYLVHVAPLYLAGLMLVNGLVYFVAAPYAGSKKSWILMLLAASVFWGGIAVVVFTFGFGVGGLPGVVRVSGAVLLAACVYELVAYLIYRKAAKSPVEREEIQ